MKDIEIQPGFEPGCVFTVRASTRTLRIWFVHATSKGTLRDWEGGGVGGRGRKERGRGGEGKGEGERERGRREREEMRGRGEKESE